MTHRGPLTDAHDRLAAELAELAELADDYLIEEELGRGASATVFLAQDLRHGRRAGGGRAPTPTPRAPCWRARCRRLLVIRPSWPATVWHSR